MSFDRINRIYRINRIKYYLFYLVNPVILSKAFKLNNTIGRKND